jgi:2-isopropylmalate synthase
MQKLGLFTSPLKIQRYRVIEEKTSEGLVLSEAMLKVKVEDKLFHRVAEGDGPVNALDNAIRLTLREKYDFMDELELENFSVKVSSEEGSASKVRVWAHFVDGKDSWQTAGVSENIVTASFEALMDGVNYKIMKEGL